MLIDELNKLLCSKEINNILLYIAKMNDKRMCLNIDVIKCYRQYFEKILLLSFVVEIFPSELKEIYEDADSYISRKITEKLHIKDIKKNRDKIEDYFNAVLGNKQIIFHGTTSYMKKYFINNLENTRFNKEECEIIDKIYRHHGIYKIFESGIRDFKENNFFITRFPNRACFYALQSPEYFARFASRSDYYKQDIFKYDRLAYFRKDYYACRKNIKKEMKEFGFHKQEKQVVLKKFNIMWNNIVFKNMKSIILFNELKSDNLQHFNENETLFEMLLKYFPKTNFKYDFNQFKENIKEIVLPDIKTFLKRQKPLFNQKYIIENNKKYIPDFYVDCKYSQNKYFALKNKNNSLIQINKNVQCNEFSTLISLVNEARPNTYRAKKFLKQSTLPKLSEVITYYQHEFEKKLNELLHTKDMDTQLCIIKEICENIGLKYVTCLKYNKFFKDINQYNIYQYRKYLGVRLFETYDGISVIKIEKIKKLINLYKDILKSESFILNEDIPFKIFNNDIELVK